MRDVLESAKTMGPEQLFLVLVFLAGYALALGEFASPRGRAWAVAGAVTAAIAFTALCTPWEAGVVLVAFGAVGMGLFSALVWTLSAATTTVRVAGEGAQASATNLPRTRATSSARPVNTAPILNSPAAE
jgi:hypothetical protein